jgi:hypothetical protein
MLHPILNLFYKNIFFLLDVLLLYTVTTIYYTTSNELFILVCY